MFPVQCEELRINHIISFFAVTMPYACWFLWQAHYIEDFMWRLHFQFGVAFGRVVLREVYFEGPNCVWRALRTSILNTAPVPCPWMDRELCDSREYQLGPRFGEIAAFIGIRMYIFWRIIMLIDATFHMDEYVSRSFTKVWCSSPPIPSSVGMNRHVYFKTMS